MGAPLNTTSADAKFFLTASGIFPAPIQLQGFQPDNMWNSDAVDNAETQIGADGKMSAGWVPSIKVYTIFLQAGSTSQDVFDLIYATETTQRAKLSLGGILLLPSQNKAYSFNKGVLKNMQILPNAAKIVQGRSYVTHWESITVAPTG